MNKLVYVKIERLSRLFVIMALSITTTSIFAKSNQAMGSLPSPKETRLALNSTGLPTPESGLPKPAAEMMNDPSTLAARKAVNQLSKQILPVHSKAHPKKQKYTRAQITEALANLNGGLPKAAKHRLLPTLAEVKETADHEQVMQAAQQSIDLPPGFKTVTIQPKPAAQAPAPAKAPTPAPTNNAAQPPGTAPIPDDNKPQFSLQNAVGLGDQDHIAVNGFLTAGLLRTDTGPYYQIPGHGNVRNTTNFAANSLLGLQVVANLPLNFAVVGQVVADGDDTYGQNTFNVNADWLYLRYLPNRNIQLRAGRFRMPALLYSETAEVGYTFPWLVLPNEVYGILPNVNLNGFDTVASYPIGQTNWTLRSQVFFGQNSSRVAIYNTFNPNLLSGAIVSFNEDDVYGGSLSVGSQYFTVKGMYMSLNTSATVPQNDLLIFNPITGLRLATCPNGTTALTCTIANKARSDFYSLAAKIDIYHVLLEGEYAQRNTSAIIASLRGYYVMLGYQFHNFLPNLTYADVVTTNTNQLITGLGQFPIAEDSWTLGLDYTINANLRAKASVSLINTRNGTFGFFTANPGRGPFYLYGASINAIF